jgi:hypothetical protein
MTKGNPELTHARGVPPERMFAQSCACKNNIIVYIVIRHYVGDGTFICFEILVVGV